MLGNGYKNKDTKSTHRMLHYNDGLDNKKYKQHGDTVKLKHSEEVLHGDSQNTLMNYHMEESSKD